MKQRKLNSFKKQSGFTLIELVVVIAILGILAVTAIPKFIDLSAQASQAAVDGVAGALNSGGAINYAAKLAGSTSYTTVAACADASALLQGGGLPTGYSISGTIPACTVSDGTYSANFTAIAVGS